MARTAAPVAWLLPLLAVLILGGPAAHADSTVPLEVHGDLLVVVAELNGRVQGRFLLDTGATFCVVSEQVARRAKLRGRTSGDKVELFTVDGSVDAVLAEARRISVAGETARDVAVAVIEEEPVHGLTGILGQSFLSRFRYTIDRDAGALLLDD